MSYSVVEICNIALTAVNATTISSITADSKEARVCNALYGITKDMLLREHTWNFAMTRASLPRDTTTPSFEFTYQYNLPADCIKVVRTQYSTDKYRIEGKKLLANRGTMNIQYVSSAVDEVDFDPIFVHLLAMELAVQIGTRLGLNRDLMNGIERRRLELRFRAKEIDGKEGTPQELYFDTWADSRLSNSSYIFKQGE